MDTVIQALRVINGEITPAAGNPTIADSLRILDSVAANEEIAIQPRLRHFLKQRSYQKALQFCRHEALSGSGCAPKS